MRVFFIFLAFVCILSFGGMTTGCHVLGPRSPVADFARAPSDTLELAEQLEARLAEVENLAAELAVTGRHALGLGKISFPIHLRVELPDRLKLAIPREPMGNVLVFTQNGAELLLYQYGDPYGSGFYRGMVEDLEGRGDLWGGLKPMDLARPLLAHQQLAEGLRRIERALPPPSFWYRTWTFRDRLATGDRLVYRVRRRDGLIREMELQDEAGETRAVVRYEDFEEREGGLFPTVFEIELPRAHARLQARLGRLIVNRPVSERVFSVEPPAGRTTLPLSFWIENLETR